jgi:dTDP-4-amino-4,6-dideoxygalactose transaminase
MKDRIRATRIALDPHLPLGEFFTSRAPAEATDALSPGSGGKLCLSYSGTSSLYLAFRAMQVGAGARVLLPAYNCGHEIEAARRTGARLDYYRVGGDLRPDLGHIAELLAKPCTVLVVTHFFGFPPAMREISELCRRQGVKLIEDCAHCLLEPGNPGGIGLHADAAVFSLRKTLPIATGGAVWLKAGTGFDWQAIAPPRLSVMRRELYLLSKALRASPGRWQRSPAFWAARGAYHVSSGLCGLAQWLGRIQHDPEDESLGFPDETLSWDMDSWSRGLLRSFNYPDIAARRRRNFSVLHEVFRERWPQSLLLPSVRAPVCPLGYAFRAKDRARLLARLNERGVPALDWWSQYHPAVPWDQFPVEQGLKDQVIALPVHQDLDADALAAMLAALGEAEELI